MQPIIDGANAFMNIFKLGGEQFVSWVSGIVPMVLMLLVLMNAIIMLVGNDKMEKFAKFCSRNAFLRYFLLPFIAAFMLGNPLCMSIGKFMPEFYKPAYYASVSYHCHTNSGLFPHINPAELFIYLGIAKGITDLGLDATPLALCYMLTGFVCNFISGWSTELTTKIVEKQQGVKLSREMKVASGLEVEE